MIAYKLKPTRRRLRLGRGGAVYLTTTLLILAAAIYTQANLLFWSFGLMVGGLVVSLGLATISLRKMQIQRVLPSHGVVDEPLVLRYQISNRSRLAVFGLILYETWGRGWRGWKKTGPASARQGQLGGRPFGWLLHLGSQQTLQAEATCWPKRRGPIVFEKIVLDSNFPFGVIHKTAAFETLGEVLVYPRLYRIHRRLLLQLSHTDVSGSQQIERRGGYEDFYGLRPYRPGDSIKLIDWRHTASTGNMVTREMAQPSPPQVMIVLDLHPPHEQDAGEHQYAAACERAISLAASLICDAYLNGYQIGLEIMGSTERFNMHHSLPHRTRMMDALAHVNPQALERSETMREQPSVIVRTGHGEMQQDSPLDARTTLPLILGSDDLEQYVQRSSSSDLIRRSMRTTSKIQQPTQGMLASHPSRQGRRG